MITILTPLAYGHSVSPEAGLSRQVQTVPVRQVSVFGPIDLHKGNRAGEIANRNALLAYASEPYCMYTDADIVFTSHYDIEDAVVWMNSHPEMAVGAYNAKPSVVIPETDHVVTGCIICRTAAIREIGGWRMIPGRCSCGGFNLDFGFRKANCRIGYIDNRQLREV